MSEIERVPSPSQLQALQDIRRSGNPYARVHGQSQHGGWHRVMLVVEYRAKWARWSARKKRWVLTEAGATALRRAERANAGVCRAESS